MIGRDAIERAMARDEQPLERRGALAHLEQLGVPSRTIDEIATSVADAALALRYRQVRAGSVEAFGIAFVTGWRLGGAPLEHLTAGAIAAAFHNDEALGHEHDGDFDAWMATLGVDGDAALAVALDVARDLVDVEVEVAAEAFLAGLRVGLHLAGARGDT